MKKAIWADERAIETTIGALAYYYAVDVPEGCDPEHPIRLWRYAEQVDYDGWHVQGNGLDLTDSEWAPTSDHHATEIAREVLGLDTTEKMAALIGAEAAGQGVTEIATTRVCSTPGGGYLDGRNLHGDAAQIAAQILSWNRPSAAIDRAQEALGLWF